VWRGNYMQMMAQVIRCGRVGGLHDSAPGAGGHGAMDGHGRHTIQWLAAARRRQAPVWRGQAQADANSIDIYLLSRVESAVLSDDGKREGEERGAAITVLRAHFNSE
jgi:hypothetical protein